MQQNPAQRASNARAADISAKAAEAPSWIKEQNMCPNFTFTVRGLASFSLPAYSVFACIGLFFMMLFLYAKTQQLGISFLRLLLLVGAMAAGVGIGSKALFTLTQIPEFLKEPTLRNLGEIIWMSGFVFYGGLFGAILAVKLYAKVFRLSRQSFLDQITPAFPLFHFWGRIGCFFAGCCYGKPAGWGIPMQQTPDVPRIPIQLIEAGCLLVIFAGLLLLQRRRAHAPALRIYLLSYAVCRFTLEFFRGDELRGIWLGLSTSQLISLAIILYFTLSALLASMNHHIHHTENWRKKSNEKENSNSFMRGMSGDASGVPEGVRTGENVGE